MITCIAVDDEPRALDVISIHASKMDELKVLGMFTDPFAARDFLRENPVDIVFLDINMPGLNGLQLLDQLKITPNIVFTTAYSEYAIDSYEYEAVDYLLKPIEFDRFAKAFYRVKKLIELEKGNGQRQNKYIFLKDGYKQIKVTVDEILYIRSDGNYLNVHTSGFRVNTRMTLNQINEMLSPDNFIRIHNSYIINLDKVEIVESNHVIIDDIRIAIGPQYKESFLALLNK